MARYRPIDTRVWTDRKFMALSDDGKMLWLYLLASPFALPIPGVIVAGEMAMSESLGWTTKRYREGHRELHAKGLSVRVDGRLIWLSKAFEYQKIQGPKHITAMAKCWDDVPDCDTKCELYEALKIACKSWSKLFDKGFAIPHRRGIGYGNTQEQEQEQEQEQDQEQERGCAPKRATQIPDDWFPSRSAANEAAESEAKGRGVDLGRELLKLRDWAKAKGATGKDWDARWRNWIREARGSANSNRQSGGPSQALLDMAMGDS